MESRSLDLHTPCTVNQLSATWVTYSYSPEACMLSGLVTSAWGLGFRGWWWFGVL